MALDRQPFNPDVHERLWGQLPAKFRTSHFDLTDPDFARIFSNTRTRRLDLALDDLPKVLGQEILWWIWFCGDTGARRLNPGWVSTMAAALVELLPEVIGPIESVADVDTEEWIRAVKASRYRRLGRMPTANSVQVVLWDVRHLQRTITQQHSPLAWWQLDTWAPAHDPRIPISRSDPSSNSRINFRTIKHAWLREGMKHQYRIALETGRGRWGSLLSARVSNGRYLDDFLTERSSRSGVDHGPKLVEDPAEELRGFVIDYVSYLRSRQVVRGPNRGKPLAVTTVSTAVSALTLFYEFAFENRRELASITGDSRWGELNGAHLRLGRYTSLMVRPPRRWEPPPGLGYIAAEDLSTMLEHLDVLGMPCDQTKSVTVNGVTTQVPGLGDPSSMRAWLLQAMTGRRCNEILKCVFNPLERVDALRLPAGDSDKSHDVTSDGEGGREEEFIARFHFRQTKIDQAPSTILVGRDVVTVIETQQAWVRHLLNLRPEDPDPPFLFPRLRRNKRGLYSRPDSTYHSRLVQLSNRLGLVDRHGHQLMYSKSHRLRHTKATTLLNLGASVHVVMRYLGQHSPEMALYYGRTLEETAERELLQAKAIGRDGRELDLTAGELVDMLGVSARTDRVLPTGLCLLPPTKRCDRGNACYSCHFFATDQRYLDDHRQLLAATLELIEQRKQLHLDRTGQPMTDKNVWLEQQLTTVRSLQLIIDRLQQGHDAPNAGEAGYQGAGTHGRPGYQPRQPVTITIGPRPGRTP